MRDWAYHLYFRGKGDRTQHRTIETYKEALERAKELEVKGYKCAIYERSAKEQLRRY